MSRSRFRWPFSVFTTKRVMDNGAVVWPSGIEQFSYVFPRGARMNIVVACEFTPQGRKYWVYRDSIDAFVDGSPIAERERDDIINGLTDYFVSTKKAFEFV